MFKRLLLLSAVAVAAIPTAASATTSPSSAQQQCTKLRATMGSTAFTQAYPSFGTCVSKLAPVDQGNAAVANAHCQGVQGGKNAFGKCVSDTVKSNVALEQAATPNPSQTCRAARTSLGTAAFDAKYKTFGKCVSSVAKAQVNDEAQAASQCRTDSTVTSSTDANAFGKCVVAKTHAANAARKA